MGSIGIVVALFITYFFFLTGAEVVTPDPDACWSG